MIFIHLHPNNKRYSTMKKVVLDFMAGAAVICGIILFAGCTESNKRGLIINEICGEDADGLEWIEVGNASSDSICIKGYKLRKMDVEGLEKKVYTFPDITLGPGDIYTVNTEDLKAHIPYKKAVIIELENNQGDVIDSFDSEEELNRESHPRGGSYARTPNLTGEWSVVSHATWNAPNSADSAIETDDADFDEELEE